MTKKKKPTQVESVSNETTEQPIVTNADAVAEVVSNAAPPNVNEKPPEAKVDKKLHSHPAFKHVDKGERKGVLVLDRVDDDGKPQYSWLCSTLRVMAVTRDDGSENWGRLLEVTDRDGVTHEWAMPSTMMAGSGLAYREVLMSYGLDLAPGAEAQKDLHCFIATAKPKDKARCVDKVGWHNERYIMPDISYGDVSGERIVFQNYGLPPKYEVKGTLKEWQQHIGRYCAGNSRLILTVTAALAGPLLYLVSEESSGINLYGQSSGGKTTALHVGASVFGTKIRTWRTTDNAAENLALSANDNTLFLDELSQVDGRVAGEMVYMLGNGQRKQRMNSNTTSRPEVTWRVIFLSSGEITLRDKLRESDKTYKAGQGVRLVDIPSDARKGYLVFENIHEFPDGDNFAQHLRYTCESGQYRGTAGRAFLEHIAANVDKVRLDVQARIKEWCAENVDAEADGQVKRVARKFATLAAAGEIAIEIGILPWTKGEAEEGVAQCFDDWVRMRGGDEDPIEITEAIRQVLNLLETHGSSRFEPIGGDSTTKVHNRLGFYDYNKETELEYYMFPDAFRDACKGANSKAVARALVDKGFMTGEVKGGKTSISKSIKGHGKQRFYYFTTINIESMRKYVAKLG